MTSNAMLLHTNSGLPVHFIKDYRYRRIAPMNDPMGRNLVNEYLDCIQTLATGRDIAGNASEHYDKIESKLATWLKDEIGGDFHPDYVVAVPSSRSVSNNLALSLSCAYSECEDLSSLFTKSNSEIRSGSGGVSQKSLLDNLSCNQDLKRIKSGNSILIVDDIISSGASMDSMRDKIGALSGAEGLNFRAAAILWVNENSILG